MIRCASHARSPTSSTPPSRRTSIRTRCARGWSSCLALVELLARGVHDVPLGAEGLRALALGLTGLRVAREGVQRAAVVGHLRLAVLALGGAEQRSLHAGARVRLAGGEGRWPELGALSIAGALAVLVLLEQVERLSVPVHEDLAEIADLLELDRGRLRAVGARGGVRAGGRAADHQRDHAGNHHGRHHGEKQTLHGAFLSSFEWIVEGRRERLPDPSPDGPNADWNGRGVSDEDGGPRL